MRTELLNEAAIPPFDAQIVQYVAEKGESPYGSTEMIVGIGYRGSVYRSITTEGLTEYMGCTDFLHDLGLVDLLENQVSFKGFDSLFVLPDDKNIAIGR